jgi:opacity protein-like surface antigen
MKCLYFLFFISCCLTSHADDWSDRLHLNTYFTLDLSHADSDVNISNSVNNIRTYSADKPSIKNSLFGGQFEFELTDNLSVFGQGIAFYDVNGSATTDTNWVYLSYDLNNDLTARLGLFPTPLLQGTELSTLGYTRLWARPLTPGNGASGINEYRGLNIVKKLANDNYNWEFQFSLGKGKHDLESMIEVDGIQLISAKFEYNQFWLRTALMRAEYDFYTPNRNLVFGSTEIILASIEGEFELNNIIVNFGASKGDGDGIPKDTMQYLSVGYQINDFTPFAFFTKTTQEFIAFNIGPPPSRPPPPGGVRPLGPPPSPPDGKARSYHFGAGLRWNVANNYALKLQYEHIRTHDKSGRRDTLPETEGNIVSFVIEGAF